ncbi:two component transcriptional regulator, AraC family [Paenibacillus sp. yr247]|uniref:response regulator transcription factor n=1 Tax=Paenibacillus sp. yr247 TaxID=1761880 RepID=UPI000885DEAC|nr:helix-turn-helix domain-containing protein [Paenibacillus sp. yr247]SDO23698.1 two component transcriptional regulator, AraC family [Paenibacillus sp. yr247]
MNVLLVDDEPLELEQLEFLIKPLCPHWNLYMAIDGSQAIALSKQVNFELAFLDINLPGRSGLEVGEEMKKQNEKVNLVIVTAFQDFQYAKQSIKLGVVDYLTKPIIESELKEIVGKFGRHERYPAYSQIVLETLKVVNEKYSEKLNLTDIASEIHVNPSYLSRRFSEEVGYSFSEYLINYRVEIAKKLLITQFDLSISQVAEITGFNSQHYFSTLFRKMVGITPRDYREVGK